MCEFQTYNKKLLHRAIISRNNYNSCAAPSINLRFYVAEAFLQVFNTVISRYHGIRAPSCEIARLREDRGKRLNDSNTRTRE